MHCFWWKLVCKETSSVQILGDGVEAHTHFMGIRKVVYSIWPQFSIYNPLTGKQHVTLYVCMRFYVTNCIKVFVRQGVL